MVHLLPPFGEAASLHCEAASWAFVRWILTPLTIEGHSGQRPRFFPQSPTPDFKLCVVEKLSCQNSLLRPLIPLSSVSCWCSLSLSNIALLLSHTGSFRTFLLRASFLIFYALTLLLVRLLGSSSSFLLGESFLAYSCYLSLDHSC